MAKRKILSNNHPNFIPGFVPGFLFARGPVIERDLMHTPQVTREFRDKCEQLAQLSRIPSIRIRLFLLAAKYNRILQELEMSESPQHQP